MEMKQEPDDIIEDQNFEWAHIKQEKDDNPSTKYFQDPCIHGSGFNQIIDCAYKNYDLVQTNNTKKPKKGPSSVGKSIMKKNSRSRIFLCRSCGYMCKKKVEFCCHFSSNHFLNNKNLFRTKINKKDENKIKSGRETSIDVDVKAEIEIVDHELKEEFDEIREPTNSFKNSDDLKLCSNDMVISDLICYCSKTDNNPVKCKICSQESRHRQSMSILCQMNGESSEPECCLNEHLHTHKDEKPDIGSSSFKQNDHLKNHLPNYTKLFECAYCMKYFTQKSNLEGHMRTHTGEKPFKCTICTKSFSRKCVLNCHLRTHTGEKPFKCNVCTKSFSQEGNLKNHLLIHTGEKHFKCNVCTISFSHKCILDRHMRTHTGEKPFKCDFCTKYFSRKGNLESHVRTHSGEKPYKCDVCTKSFSQKCILYRHLRTHTGEKLFKCDVCTKPFSRKGSLKCHLRTHTGEKPYKCDVCTKLFSQKSNLRMHQSSHTDEKPFKCDICTKFFSQKSYLRKHLRIHIGDKPFECE